MTVGHMNCMIAAGSYISIVLGIRTNTRSHSLRFELFKTKAARSCGVGMTLAAQQLLRATDCSDISFLLQGGAVGHLRHQDIGLRRRVVVVARVEGHLFADNVTFILHLLDDDAHCGLYSSRVVFERG